jgi:hypothetical protein
MERPDGIVLTGQLLGPRRRGGGRQDARERVFGLRLRTSE